MMYHPCFDLIQVMYAYVMRPETLPPSYWNFIVKTGPLEKNVLEWVRLNCRGRPIDLAAVESYVSRSRNHMFSVRCSVFSGGVVVWRCGGVAVWCEHIHR